VNAGALLIVPEGWHWRRRDVEGSGYGVELVGLAFAVELCDHLGVTHR